MKILFSIVLNSSILYFIQFLLNTDKYPNAVVVAGGWKMFLLGGVILGLLNFTIKPLLKIIGLPFLILMHGIFTLFINGVILWMLQKTVNDILMLPNMTYMINGTLNFTIAVAIFTILNMLYGILFSKK